jgi:hypothetical protein
MADRLCRTCWFSRRPSNGFSRDPDTLGESGNPAILVGQGNSLSFSPHSLGRDRGPLVPGGCGNNDTESLSRLTPPIGSVPKKQVLTKPL